MLRINRVKAISRTKDIDFGFDYTLLGGLNLISSKENTQGKSSAILAIFYCLGFEEIIGGKGRKTMTSVYKSEVDDEKHQSHQVLESEALIEVTNGTKTISIRRAIQTRNRNENLITVFFCDLDSIDAKSTYAEDMYVHSHYSATAEKGFHTFLERFIGLELPIVTNSDGAECKLYMQLIFSAIFIEQKRGWSDILSAMPIYNIKEAKKRVVEYILGLDTFTNAKKKALLKSREQDIQRKWTCVLNELMIITKRENCLVHGFPSSPTLLNSDFSEKVSIVLADDVERDISDEILRLEEKRDELKTRKPKIVDNFDSLQKELEETESSIRELEIELNKQNLSLAVENASLKRLKENLSSVDIDLRNNKDAKKLKDMGADFGIESYSGQCPVCRQAIQDSLLPIQNCDQIMSIEENIQHLNSQRTMIAFAIDAHKENREALKTNINSLLSRINTLRRLAKTIRNDLFSIDEDLSETLVHKRIDIENRIQALNELNIQLKTSTVEILELSNQWKQHLIDIKSIPKRKISSKDEEKLATLEGNFKRYLQIFNYQSVNHYNTISISRENYLPVSEGFDMKFDSSASDNIRAIWAYTLALLLTSNEKGGNHPQVVIFDEPKQQSIISNDTKSLLKCVIDLKGNKQVLLGITLDDLELRQAIKKIDKEDINIIDVGLHSFQPNT